MSSAKWRPFCLGHLSAIIFCISSEILNDNSSVVCKCAPVDGSVSSCPQAASHYANQVLSDSTAHLYIYGPSEICIPVANWRYGNLALSQFSNAGNLTRLLLPFVHLTPWIWYDCNFASKRFLRSGLTWATHMKLTRFPRPVIAWNLHDLMPTLLRELSGKIAKFIATPSIAEIVKFLFMKSF